MSKISGVVNGFYRCNDERSKEINTRLYQRNIPSQPLKPNFGFRPEQTKFKLPMDIKPKVVIQDSNVKPYNMYNTKDIFNPGNDRAPVDGYFSNVDKESLLRNQIHPLQKADQSKYIPSTNSDLFKTIIQSKKEPQPHPHLFTEQQFNSFNPNPQNLGKKTFNNSTRVDLKNK